ncbi:MAG TPA: glutamate 5-kinase [Chromatiales bacterium]|nr:glutamate 5-kinase [Chromatiales bacterium]
MAAQPERWVVKIGSSLVTNDGRGLDHAAIAGWAEQVARLEAQGISVVLVCSGAVAEGMARLGWNRRPRALNRLQAAAAVGQMGLVQSWEKGFAAHGRHAAQVLLTHEDLADRRRYLNARSTLRTLLELGTVPVVNENDTVATEEIQFGDNDTLGALVANLIEADALVILTDIEGLYTGNPRKDPEARLVPMAKASDPRLDEWAGPSHSELGRGGMHTKIAAARKAARSGTRTHIVSGREPEVLLRLARGEDIGTRLLPDSERLAARKQWLGSQLRSAGTLHLDAGAVTVLREAGSSLLPVGVTAVEGEFRRGDMVTCVGPDGRPVARGLVNYSSSEVARIRGQHSDRIAAILGYEEEPELIHRDNLVLV